MTTAFAQDLKKRRLERGWSQQQLAIKAGLTRACIGAYEENRADPPLSKFYMICKAFGITVILN